MNHRHLLLTILMATMMACGGSGGGVLSDAGGGAEMKARPDQVIHVGISLSNPRDSDVVLLAAVPEGRTPGFEVMSIQGLMPGNRSGLGAARGDLKKLGYQTMPIREVVVSARSSWQLVLTGRAKEVGKHRVAGVRVKYIFKGVVRDQVLKQAAVIDVLDCPSSPHSKEIPCVDIPLRERTPSTASSGS